jgi:hypothetical protein
MNALTLTKITIRQDAEGRYCLNDLHKASGGEQRHQPRYWLENLQTQELVQELSDSGNPLSLNNSPITIIKGGKNQGTFVVKELVYAYAMWISPRFHLQVIRAYDELVAQKVTAASKLVVRHDARVEYKPMQEALRQSREELGKETKHFHYSNEADMLNRIVLGMTSKQYKEHHSLLEDKSLRDTLTNLELAAFADLERANKTFIDLGYSFEERKEQLKTLFNRKHLKALTEEVHRLES